MSIVILTAGGHHSHRTQFMNKLAERIAPRGVNVIPVKTGGYVFDLEDLERTSSHLKAFAEQVYGALQDSEPNMYIFDSAPIEPLLRLSYSNEHRHRELANEVQEIVRHVTESSMTVVAPPIPASVLLDQPELADRDIDDERDADFVAFDAVRYDEMRRYMCAGITSIELTDHPSWTNAFYELGVPYDSWIETAVKLTESSFDRSYKAVEEAQ